MKERDSLLDALCHVVPSRDISNRMNRLKELLGNPQEPERPDDFYEIEYRHEIFVVTRQTAEEVEQRLDRRPLPRWITFSDLSGARHKLLASNIGRISESTVEQRAAERAFRRARRLEDKSDRLPWDEDDF